jgi:hypothetical protein
MPGVVELIDRAVDLPPGPRLAATLAELPWSRIPNARLVEVLQAHSRQLAHHQAGLLAGMAEITRAVPAAGLPDGAVARAGEDFEWASHEIAAGLTWTPPPPTANSTSPASWCAGCRWCSPPWTKDWSTGGRRKCSPTTSTRPAASSPPPRSGDCANDSCRWPPGGRRAGCRGGCWPRSRRLSIDPGFHRRRYRRGLRERGVVLHLDRDGTATLAGQGLPPDEAAAAAARLDRLAEAAKRAGHPGRLGQISADLYLGMLDGSFYGLTEPEILARLLAQPRPEDTADTADTADARHSGEGDTGDGGGDSTDTDTELFPTWRSVVPAGLRCVTGMSESSWWTGD